MFSLTQVIEVAELDEPEHVFLLQIPGRWAGINWGSRLKDAEAEEMKRDSWKIGHVCL